MNIHRKSPDLLPENFYVKVTGKTLTAMSAVMLVVLLATLPVGFLRNDNIALIFQFSLIFFMILNIWFIQTSGNLLYAVLTIIIPAFFILLYSLSVSGTNDSISWFFIFPIISFFFLGKRIAVITNAFLWIFMLAALNHRINALPEGYISIFIHGLSYLGVTVLCFFYESHRENIQSKLLESSLTDYLTGCSNRRAFEKDLLVEIDNCKRHNQHFCLVIMDLDNFKKINDSVGHSAGDTLLKEISSLIKKELRKNDTLYRMGGDEFTLLLPHTGIDGGLVLTKRIVESIAAAKFTNDLRSTASAGISSSENSKLISDEIMRDADVALYLAKKHGRNRVERSQLA
jgi:diguanylate cyclase (GGDEF)-like protein